MRSKTKIDYIWILQSWSLNLVVAKMYDTEHIIASNHKLLLAKVETGLYKRKTSFVRLYKKDRDKVSIDLKKITEEDWINYKEKLEKEFKKSFKEDKKYKHQAFNKTDLLEDSNIDKT
ncbi:11528_t:CDS:1 [Dentiscutata heterogama]|uniref:11528_t:CDS:1 n=1 Tax=Dentiscutata heterogama TaxID=1316150 RepID=A0ACA9M041_9GLOM|nr:11528_t:CDS:1 [Dentiscutata heterogama]